MRILKIESLSELQGMRTVCTSSPAYSKYLMKKLKDYEPEFMFVYERSTWNEKVDGEMVPKVSPLYFCPLPGQNNLVEELVKRYAEQDKGVDSE